MPCYNTRTSSTIIMILPMLVIFTLCSTSLKANPFQNKDSLTGIWTGIIKDKDIKAEVTIKPAADNNDYSQYSLHYGDPRSCRVTAEELSVDEGVISLLFNEASGGFCDKLFHGMMTITISDDNHLSIQIVYLYCSYLKLSIVLWEINYN